MLYQVKHNSDCRFIESWIGSFEKFVNEGCEYLSYSFDEIKEYASKLSFDGANHEKDAPYVKAWIKRREIEEKGRNNVNNEE